MKTYKALQEEIKIVLEAAKSNKEHWFELGVSNKSIVVQNESYEIANAGKVLHWFKGTWKRGVWKRGIWKGGYDENGDLHKAGDSPDKWNK